MKHITILTTILLLSIITVGAATVSHSAAQITPGAFAVGNYWFTGSIGIGTDSPNAPLQIGTHTWFNRGSTWGTPTLVNTSSGDRIVFYGPTGTYKSAIGMNANNAVFIQAHGGTILELWGATASTEPTEKVTFTTDGKVGIGRTDPAAKLEIQGADGSNALNILNTAEIQVVNLWPDGNGNGKFTLKNSSGATKILLESEKSRDSYIANDGNFGIGTTTPSAKLDVVGTVKADAFIAPAIRLSLPTALNVGGGTGADSFAIDWNTIDSIDTDYFTFTAGGTTVTIDQAGWYEIKAHLVADNTGAARYSAWARGYKNDLQLGPGFRDKGYSRGAAYGDYLAMQVNTDIYFSAGDTFRLDWYRRAADQTTAVNLAITYCNLIITRVGD